VWLKFGSRGIPAENTVRLEELAATIAIVFREGGRSWQLGRNVRSGPGHGRLSGFFVAFRPITLYRLGQVLSRCASTIDEFSMQASAPLDFSRTSPIFGCSMKSEDG
jgi:hypothetical protein